MNNPFTIIIKNDTGIGFGTKVCNEEGKVLEGVQGIHVDVVHDDAVYADLRLILVRLDVKATTRQITVSCSVCGEDVDLGKPIKLLEGSMNKDGMFPVMCHKCVEREEHKHFCVDCKNETEPTSMLRHTRNGVQSGSLCRKCFIERDKT